MKKTIKRIFGIDLGTTYSAIAYVDEYGKAVIIPNAENERTTPSVVFFDEKSVSIGAIARENAKLSPNNSVSFIKRSMGEPDYVFEHDSETYRAEEISAYILKKLAQDAQRYLGEQVTDVVITCPAYFGINEREATRKAGEIAGFNVRQIINEPTAAAIAYGSLNKSEDRVVIVYDLGGGTFDITMIDIRKDSVEVICTGGDHNLGGKDWDDRIVTYLAEIFEKETGLNEDILADDDTCHELQLYAEKAKRMLSQRLKTPISITHRGKIAKFFLERQKFEEVTADLLDRTIDFTRKMLQTAREKGYDRFDEIILVGGATRMPCVAERINKELGILPKIFDPDEAVAKGAAIFGWKLALNDDLIRRVSEKTQKEIETWDNLSQMMDTKEVSTEDFSEATRELAEDTGYTVPSVESAILKVVKNVTSKSFGVVAYNSENKEIVYNLVLRNTSVPVRIKKTFSTAVENQKLVLIRTMENETGKVEIPIAQAVEVKVAFLHLPPGLPADFPIEITFDINEEGRLHITAEETSGSGKVNIVVNNTSVIDGIAFKRAKARSQSLVVH